MLSNKAINLMLKTYKGLSSLKVLDSGNTNLGQSNVAWGTPNNNTIKTLPFTVLAEKQPTSLPVRYFEITGTVPKASTRKSVLDFSNKDTDLNYYSRLSEAYEQSLQSDYPIIDGIKYGNNVYEFKLFRTNISAPLPNIPNENLTGTYNATGPEIIESLYEFVDSRVNVSQPIFKTIRVSVSSGGGGGTYYYVLIAMRDKYETTGNSTKLIYNLSNFGYDNTIEVDTLIKVPNGISEGMVKI